MTARFTGSALLAAALILPGAGGAAEYLAADVELSFWDDGTDTGTNYAAGVEAAFRSGQVLTFGGIAIGGGEGDESLELTLGLAYDITSELRFGAEVSYLREDGDDSTTWLVFGEFERGGWGAGLGYADGEAAGDGTVLAYALGEISAVTTVGALVSHNADETAFWLMAKHEPGPMSYHGIFAGMDDYNFLGLEIRYSVNDTFDLYGIAAHGWDSAGDSTVLGIGAEYAVNETVSVFGQVAVPVSGGDGYVAVIGLSFETGNRSTVLHRVRDDILGHSATAFGRF